ncbi:hypothetical protein CHL78_002605 [Romboutsia weinsteinii]|uniref:SH3b domain-containing protein n=1 Tax=Romboutsia weinsteinii TaxID=2020949 RepID=A0A371J965_9FIRM|nr:3D domain-containing protein [Romboutsia weinsteinii]RDY29217.1 hypothetical protein CHL78_002605 [Romboutsia weinsteinii]
MKRKILITITTLSLLAIQNIKSFAEMTTSENTSITIENTQDGQISANSVNFRTGPSMSHSVNYSLNKDESVDIIKVEGDWTKVNHNETVGYIHSDYVSNNEDVSSQEASIDKSNKINVKATAYAGDTITSTGTVPKWGTIAVDPTIIPYGTKVYIPEFDKVFIAEDTGSAIKGNRIDIFMDTEEHCNEWGIRSIEIYLQP